MFLLLGIKYSELSLHQSANILGLRKVWKIIPKKIKEERNMMMNQKKLKVMKKDREDGT